MSDIYMYRGGLYCEDCADKIKADIMESDPDREDWPEELDSDLWPQYCQSDESDSPDHCEECHVFLENDLTPEGIAYVRERIGDYLQTGNGDRDVLREWADFYFWNVESLIDFQPRRW